jgi:hypothetical protein
VIIIVFSLFILLLKLKSNLIQKYFTLFKADGSDIHQLSLFCFKSINPFSGYLLSRKLQRSWYSKQSLKSTEKLLGFRNNGSCLISNLPFTFFKINTIKPTKRVNKTTHDPFQILQPSNYLSQKNTPNTSGTPHSMSEGLEIGKEAYETLKVSREAQRTSTKKYKTHPQKESNSNSQNTKQVRTCAS